MQLYSCEGGSKTGKLFKNQALLEEHHAKHGQEIADVLGETNYSIDKYLDDENYIINNGTCVPELQETAEPYSCPEPRQQKPSRTSMPTMWKRVKYLP